MINREDVKHIAEHYGYNAQSRQCIEEMAELTQAINKFWRYEMKCGEKDFCDIPYGVPLEDNIIEEIADVEICLAQLKCLMCCHDEVNEIARGKIERELYRIKTSNKDVVLAEVANGPQ